MEKYLIKLGWDLIKWRILYYYPEKFTQDYHDEESVTDTHYDLMERKYIRLCKIYKQPNTVASMIQVDMKRPSVQLVLDSMLARGSPNKRVRRDRKKRFTK